MAKLRAAVYVRRSSAQGLDRSQSPAVQEEAALRYIEEKGWICDPGTDIFRDLGKSAWRPSSKRPGFDRLLTACADGRYNRLVVYLLDRLSRDWAQWGRILEALPEGFEIVSAGEGISSANKVTLALFAAIAQEASDKISMRVRASKARRASQGAWMGSIRPFGFVPVEVDGRRTLALNRDSREPEALRAVIDKVLGGMNVTDAARWLQEQGWATTMPGRDGQEPRWHHVSLMRLLRSPVLYGGPASKSNEMQLGPDGKPLIVGEPLVPLDKFLRLRQRLDSQRQTRAKPKSSLLVGIVRCATCCRTMGAAGEEGSHTSVYRCRSERYGTHCTGCHVSRRRLDEHVSLLAVLLLVRPTQREPTDRQAERIAEVTVAIEALMGDLYPTGPQPSPEVRNALRKRLGALEAELEEAKKVTNIRRGPARIPKALREALRRDFAGVGPVDFDALAGLVEFRGLATEAQRALVASVIESVWVGRRTRQEALAVPIEQRGRIEGRLTISLPDDPDTRLPYIEALELAVTEAARQLTVA